MSWQTLLFIHSLLAAAGALLARKMSAKGNIYGSALSVMIFGASFIIGLLAAAFFTGVFQLPEKTFFYFLLILEGTLFSLRSYLFLEMNQYVSASIAMILNSLSTLFVVLIASIFLGERLSTPQFLGAVLMIIAVYTVSRTQKNKTESKNFRLGLVIGLIISVLFGVAITAEKYLLDNMGLGNYLVFGWGFQFLASLVLAVLLRRKWRFPKAAAQKFAYSYVLLYAVSGAFFVFAVYGSGNVSQVSSLSGLKVVLTAALAYIFLRERHAFGHILLAGLFTFFGIYLLLT